MSTLGLYILGLRHGRQRDREVVAEQTGISVERQRLIEEGLAIPTHVECKAYAKSFSFSSVAEFEEAWRSKRIVLSKGDANGRIPVINLAPAGEPVDYHECFPDSGLGFTYIDPPPGIIGPNLFAFVIIGDSMEPTYPSGRIAICRPTPSAEIPDGHPVFVRFGSARDHGCTFKLCYRVDAELVDLRPLNPAYKKEIVSKEHIDRMSPVIACVEAKTYQPADEPYYTNEYSQVMDESQ